MAEQNFVDYVKICCRSGVGGAGSVHFFRDNKNPKGGPDGGDGGRGGHIIVKGKQTVVDSASSEIQKACHRRKWCQWQ